MRLSRPSRLWVAEGAPVLAILATLSIKCIYATRLFDRWQVESVAVTSTLALVCACGAALMMLPRMIRVSAAILINAVATVLLTSDLIHYSFFGDLVSVAELSYVWMLPSVTQSIAQRLTLFHAWFYLDVIVAVIALPFYWRAVRDIPAARARWRIAWSTGFAVCGAALLVPGAELARRDPDHIFDWRASRTQTASALGVLPYHAFDVGSHLGVLWARTRISDGDREDVKAVLAARHRPPPAGQSPLFGVARGKNVIVIQAESLQAFPLGYWLNGQEVTPNLNRFAAESLRFTNFYDQAFLGSTSDSLFLSLQSLYALGPGEGAISTRYLDNRYRGIPAILDRHGYSSLAAMGAHGKYWLIGDMFTRLGFKRQYLDDAFARAERFGQGVADADFFSTMLPIVEQQTEPFFAFLVSVSNHHPYALPEAHRTLRLGALQGDIVGSYLDSVHYFDAAFGEFIAGLRRSGVLDRSVVVVYGDHQAFLDDTPELARTLAFPPSSAYDFWKAKKKLPLLIRLPGAQSSGPRTVIGGQADTAPTILSLLGFPSDPVMLGTDLTRDTSRLVVFRDGGFVTDTDYFINDRDVSPVPVCRNIASGRQIDCGALSDARAEAQRLEHVSDVIIRGNLVPAILPNQHSAE